MLIVACVLLMPGLKTVADDAPAKPADFTLFDNMHYSNKPDLSSQGLKGSNVIYAGYIWKGAEKSPDYGKMPDESAFKAAVKANAKQPGPVVLDFETLQLSGKPDVAEAHFTLFITLAKWTHEVMPGRVVGYYGHGLFPEEPGKEYVKQTAELTDAVDAFFPSLYTFNKDTDAWKNKADRLIQQAHKLAPAKPVYLYIWPQYHNAPHATVPADQWTFELDAAKELGANGAVIWSGKDPAWDESNPWWKATLKFVSR